MKTIYIEKPNQLSIREYNLPKLREDEILIKVSYAGICGSDIHTFKGVHSFRKPPVSIGHEVAGIVVKVGSNVTHIREGAKVTVIPQKGCERCEYCISGYENLCSNRQAPGIGEWIGTMSEYFVAPASTVIELPSTIDLKSGVLIEPLAVGFHAIEKAEVKKNDKVAILGCGTIGLLTLCALISRKISISLVTDVRDYPLRKSKIIGADISLNIRGTPNWTEKVTKQINSKFDKVFITTNAPGIINDALKITKSRGKIITVAMFAENQAVDINNLQTTEKELIGCMTYNRNNFDQALNYMEKNNENIRNQIISHVLPFKQAEEGFRMLAENRETSLKILLEL